MEWITIDNYPEDDLRPEPDEIVLLLLKDGRVLPGWFDFEVWRWEWVEMWICEIRGIPQLATNFDRQRKVDDPSVEKWAHMPKGSK